MADNFNTRIADKLMLHDIDLARLDAGNAKAIKQKFRELARRIAQEMQRLDPTGEATIRDRNRAVRALFKYANGEIEKVFAEIEDMIHEEMVEVAALEQKAVSDAVASVVVVDLMDKRINKNVLKRLADETMIEGAPSREWWKEQERSLRGAFKREIREGVLMGESIQDLVRRIRGRREHGFKDGLINYDTTASRRAAALARSSVMAVANAARFETLVENKQATKGVQWLSTLDARTSDICKALDGQAWTHEGYRLPGTEIKWRGPPPAHWNCRSTLVPVLRSWADMITDPKIRRKVQRAESKLPLGWRASMDGQVSADLKYGDWLKTKTSEFQKEVLGPTKYKLWKDGKLKFRDLIDQSHQPFTLKELADKIVKEKA